MSFHVNHLQMIHMKYQALFSLKKYTKNQSVACCSCDNLVEQEVIVSLYLG